MAGYDIGIDEFDRTTGDRDDYSVDDDGIDDDIDDDIYDYLGEDDETTFIGTPPGEEICGATSTVGLSRELLESAVNDYYNNLAEKGMVPSVGRDYSKFTFDQRGRLRLKAASNLPLVNMRTGKPQALSTIAGNPGGDQLVRSELGFVYWKKGKHIMPARAVKTIQSTDETMARTTAAIETVKLREVPRVATDAIRTMEINENEILSTMDDPRLPLRELRGIDKAMQTVRGELVLNLSKILALDEHIALDEKKLEE